MDLLDIIIIAAAALGVVAFIALTVVIVRQGRSLKRLEDRIGPPVPMAAAPSLERVRAITTSPEVRVETSDAQLAAQADALPGSGANAAADAVVRDAAGGAAAAQAQPRSTARARANAKSSTSRAKAGPGTKNAKEGGGNGALVVLISVLAVAIVAGGVWFFLLRGDGGSSTPASAGTSTSATSGTTGTTVDVGGTIPEVVPPLANKAAYTVAVLNASGVSGAAANRVAPRVQAAGYTLGVVDNAAKQDLPTSQIEYLPGRKEVAWNLGKDLGITTAVPVDALAEGRIGTADAVVVVGKDLAK